MCCTNLHYPEFNTADVDHNMHERLMQAMEDIQMDILHMWQERDSQQDVLFFKHGVEVVLLVIYNMYNMFCYSVI